jgi:hypothetical protein
VAVRRGTISSSRTSFSPKNTWPPCRIDRVIGLASTFKGAARVCGRSSGTPAVIRGAATMKTMSSTSMTSMNGVMLISLMAPRRLPRRRRRPPCPFASPAATAIA